MNLQKNYTPKTLAPPTKEEKTLAHTCHARILALIDTVKAAESDLEHNYITLGKHVYQMQVKTWWLILGYASWKEYFSFVQEKFGVGRTQLYGYVATVRELSPHVEDSDLSEMGISRASELRKAVVQTGKAPSEELIKKALDPNIPLPAFRQAVLEEFHIKDHNEKGTWYDLKGVYFTEDEKKEWEEAVDLAKNQDPVVSVTLPAHAQLKEALLRMAQEFIGTYGYHPVEQSPESELIPDKADYEY